MRGRLSLSYDPRVPRHLLLASASPRRAELLRSLGVAFEVAASGAAEIEGGDLSPADVALANARRKAQVASASRPDALVLAADTVVALGPKLFGKPATQSAAAAMLAELAGRTHEVVTGVCLSCHATNDLEDFAVSTRVTFRALAATDIAAYLARVHVLDKAGAYAIQERGDALVVRYEGSFTNVVGLPIERVKAALEKRGWTFGSG
jgi:septum formation protein